MEETTVIGLASAQNEKKKHLKFSSSLYILGMPPNYSLILFAYSVEQSYVVFECKKC